MALSIHINFTAWCFCVQHAFLSEQILIKFVLHNFTVVLVASLSHYQMLQFELHKINKGILNKVFCVLFLQAKLFYSAGTAFLQLASFWQTLERLLESIKIFVEQALQVACKLSRRSGSSAGKGRRAFDYISGI